MTELALTKATKAARILDVIRLMNSGSTQKDACQQVGISENTFRNFVTRDPDGLMIFQEMLSDTTREQIATILFARAKILNGLVNDALSIETKPGERLAIYKALEDKLGELVNEARISDVNADAAAEILAGPVLTPGKSVFSIHQDGSTTRIEIEQKPQIVIPVEEIQTSTEPTSLPD